MLEHFHVPEEDAVRIMPDALRLTVNELFLKMGMSDQDAWRSTDVLLLSDTRGVDTHGVSNMMRRYIEMFGGDFINPVPNWKVIRETPTTANVDCDRGLGIAVIPQVMELAIKKARETGIGAITMSNGRHAGMIAYHAMMALPHDMIGYSITAGGQSMPPTFGREPRLAPNPHAWAVPAHKEPPFVLDISSSSVAANKIGLLRRMGASILPGLIADDTGTPIMDERPVPDYTLILPNGGTRELGSHKGYGMSAVAQVFGGILSNGTFGAYEGGHMSHFVAAYSIEAFTDVDRFKKSMDDFLKYLRDTPTAPGHDRVYYAGLPEHEESIDRYERGIPLHKEVIDWFDQTTDEFNMARLER
jgi:LDH2 family malate/lactate/ureidoglycolate dehydrogenase